MRTVVAMIGMLLLVGACGTDDDAGPAGEAPDASTPAVPTTTTATTTTATTNSTTTNSTNSTTTNSTTTTTTGPDTTPPATGPSTVGVVAVYPDLEYYGACGNETVDVDGTRLYPLLYDDVQALDTTRYPVVAPVGLRAVAESVRVAPPGPGDDIGTLIVYDDGIARFESESGWIIWLTTTPITYRWEC